MVKEKIGGSLQTNVEKQLGISFDNFLKLDYDDQQKLVERLNNNRNNDIEYKKSEPKTKKLKFRRSK